MICAKSLQIVVAGGLRVWFPLENVGAQVDVLSGITANQVNPGFSTFTAPAGKVANGALLDKASFDSTSFGFSTGIIPALAYNAADGFTFCGWARRVSGNMSQALVCALTLFADAGGVTQTGVVSMFDASNLLEVSARGATGTTCKTSVAHVVGLGTYFFYAVTFNPATSKISFQFDNGAVITSACSVIIGTSPFAKFEFYYGLINPAGSGSFDEVCLFYPKLTQAQVDYIYNSGSGRTPPITLP